MLICSNCATVNDDHAPNCAQCTATLRAADFLTKGANEERIEQRREERLSPANSSAAPLTRSGSDSCGADLSDSWRAIVDRRHRALSDSVGLRRRRPAYLEAYAEIVGDDGRRLVVGHGYARPRQLTTGAAMSSSVANQPDATGLTGRRTCRPASASSQHADRRH